MVAYASSATTSGPTVLRKTCAERPVGEDGSQRKSSRNSAQAARKVGWERVVAMRAASLARCSRCRTLRTVADLLVRSRRVAGWWW